MNKQEKELSALQLRPCTPEDAEIIVSWLSDEAVFYRWSFGRLGDYPTNGNTLKQYFDDGNIHLIAEDENGIFGHIMLRYPQNGQRHVRCGYIVVDGSRRGTGCGHRLLTLAAEYAREALNAETLSLFVFEDNLPARRCYNAVGFKETGKREEYIIRGEKWIALETELSL